MHSLASSTIFLARHLFTVTGVTTFLMVMVQSFTWIKRHIWPSLNTWSLHTPSLQLSVPTSVSLAILSSWTLTADALYIITKIIKLSTGCLIVL